MVDAAILEKIRSWDGNEQLQLYGANLRDANLQGANLQGANLQDANLQSANLQSANLQGADLRNANLRDADLWDADLQGANLQGANLWDAPLRDANLRDAYLRDAKLQGANLRNADLRDANLQGAYLQGADLRDANLHGANLRGANFRDAKNIPALIIAQLTIVIEGRMQGWKALRGDVIAFLEIPTHAKRSNATGRKCRASEAHVVALYDKYGAPVQAGVSKYDATFDYHVGETVHCHAWEEDRWVECGGGIHFYLTREEAERD